MVIPYTPHPYIYIGQFSFRTELIFLVASFAVFSWMVYRELKKEKIKPKDTIAFILVVLISASLGGRIWYYAENFKGLASVVDFFNPMNGGMISLGMLLGGVLGMLGYSLLKSKKKGWQIEFARFADIAAVNGALAVFVYRIGCFIDGHIVGTYTNLPWGLRYANGAVTHPTALYMAFSGLLIFVILKLFFGKERVAKTRKNV